jgi:hypothetical protein
MVGERKRRQFAPDPHPKRHSRAFAGVPPWSVRIMLKWRPGPGELPTEGEVPLRPSSRIHRGCLHYKTDRGPRGSERTISSKRGAD